MESEILNSSGAPSPLASASNTTCYSAEEPTGTPSAVRSQESEPASGQPRDQLEVEEPNASEETVYPSGPKLWLTTSCICIVQVLNGFDIAVVAIAGPSITNEFKTIADIGWYSAGYGLILSCTLFFFGKCYTVFRTKPLFLLGLALFELGSVICTFAHSSKAFVIGRVVAGLGASAYGSGVFKLAVDLFPLSKQALMFSVVGGAQLIGLITAPMVGGLLIDAFSWRACFGINLPLCLLCIVFTTWAFEDNHPPTDAALPLKEKLARLDPIGTVLVIPAIVCLLMALQWGGIKYGWHDARIIALLISFIILFPTFMFWQYRQGDKATIPARIIKRPSILGALWFASCVNGIMAMTEYYFSVYFQGVKGFSPTKSGLLGLPMLVGATVGVASAGPAINFIGYYYPFLIATSVLAPVASGLLTTINYDGSVAKPSILLGMLGLAMGLGINGPTLTVRAVLPSKDVTIGGAIVGFGSSLGSSLWICISATLFQNRLQGEIVRHAPRANTTAIGKVGLSDIREIIGGDRLGNVLAGYNEAVVQTLYLPLALAILTMVGSLSMGRASLKKKQN